MGFRTVSALYPRAGIGALGALLGWLICAPAGAADLAPLRATSPPIFTCDIAITLDHDAHPALSASVTLAYSAMQWIRIPKGFAAGVAISVAFESKSGGRLYGDVWERRISVADFVSTTSRTATLTEHRAFDVPPGNYRIRVRVRDLNGEMQSEATDDIQVPDYSRVPVGFADIELGVADSAGGAFVPIPTRRFGRNASLLAARVSLFDRRPGPWPRNYTFHYRILDDLGQEIVVGNQPATVQHSADPVTVRPATGGLFLGSYAFEVQLVEGKSRWRAERTFEIEESGPPRGKDFERLLEPLSYIATAEEITHLRSLPPDKQAEGWEEFWKRRNTTPDSEHNEAQLEFFRRVRYAEQHFQGFGPGWRSDMGRIYIKFGPPEQIETRPPSADTGQIEIWTFSRPTRRFVFEDHEGFGRFVLRSPGVE